MPRARACRSRFAQAAIVRRREHRGCRLPRIVRRHERDSIGASAAEPARGSVGGDRRRPAPRVAAVTVGVTARLAIRQSVPSAVEASCLRNAANTFFYRDPDTLPTMAPATALSSEPHSFSRVFTGAFFEGLAGMLASKDTKNEAALLEVSQDMGAILVEGIRAASVVPTFFSQVAAT